MEKLLVGDRIRWTALGGTYRGEIKAIYLGKNEANQMVPWINVEYYIGNNPEYTILCASDANLKALEVEVMFRAEGPSWM